MGVRFLLGMMEVFWKCVVMVAERCKCAKSR